MCAGDPVVVVGGGNSAGQAAVFLADQASTVTVVIRGAELSANMSRYLVDRLEDHPRIAILTRTRVVGSKGRRTDRCAGGAAKEPGHSQSGAVFVHRR